MHTDNPRIVVVILDCDNFIEMLKYSIEVARKMQCTIAIESSDGHLCIDSDDKLENVLRRWEYFNSAYNTMTA